ncbi:MAG: hypothetical protein KFH87_13550, partial [Bacteroidetes bacterium]|nr:hypothetical protein [Bacteroidota bacterium]
VYIRPFLVLTLLLCFIVTTQAQERFVVMSLKGKVEARKTAGKESWNAVKVGDVLHATHTVRTSYASYVKLMTGKNRLLSIDANTTKQLSTFAGTVKRQSSGSASERLLEYAAMQMKASRSRSNEPTYGAVRGNLDVFSAVFPKYAVMTTEPRFEWVDAEAAQQYEFVLLDEAFNIVTRMQLDEAGFLYEEEKGPTLGDGRRYHWRITRLSDGLDSEIQTFQILPADTITEIREELIRLDEELLNMGADQVTLHLIRAIYFEKRGLYTDAFHEYKQTVQLAPDVQEYRDMLRNLLFHMRLYAEEEYLLE